MVPFGLSACYILLTIQLSVVLQNVCCFRVEIGVRDADTGISSVGEKKREASEFSRARFKSSEIRPQRQSVTYYNRLITSTKYNCSSHLWNFLKISKRTGQIYSREISFFQSHFEVFMLSWWCTSTLAGLSWGLSGAANRMDRDLWLAARQHSKDIDRTRTLRESQIYWLRANLRLAKEKILPSL